MKCECNIHNSEAAAAVAAVETATNGEQRKSITKKKKNGGEIKIERGKKKIVSLFNTSHLMENYTFKNEWRFMFYNSM